MKYFLPEIKNITPVANTRLEKTDSLNQVSGRMSNFFPKDKAHQICCFLLVINLIIIAKCLVRFMKLYTLQGGLIV